MNWKIKFNNWRVLLTGVSLGFLLTIGVFAIVSTITNKDKSLKWADWTGFGEDKTIEVSIEKNNKEEIVKRTETTKPQSGKTLWDVLELSGTLAVPVLLVILSYQFQLRDQKREEIKAQFESDKASENLLDDTLEAYIDRISMLLLEHNLVASSDDHPVRDVARIQTLTVLTRLKGDKKRKATVLNFLYVAGLLQTTEKKPLSSFINLVNADFEEADLKQFKLPFINLSFANLSNADLSFAILIDACLYNTNLNNAELNNAELNNADLSRARLGNAKLAQADLSRTILEGADLSGADLSYTKLINANLSGANLSGANLSGALLINTDLSNANLSGTNLSDTNLSSVELYQAQYTDNTTSKETCKLITFEGEYPCPTIFPQNFDPKAAGMELIK